MSDYENDDALPLFARKAKHNEEARIEVHHIPDTSSRELGLIKLLQPPGTPVVINDLRLNFYTRVEVIKDRLVNRLGHSIDTIDGCYVYRCGPADDFVRTPARTDQLYYRTKHWRTLSAQRIAMDGCCVQCRRVRPDITLQVHHWRYILFAEDITRDLVSLCESCHRQVHQAIKNSSVSFPKRISAKVLERIEKESRCS